MAGQTSVPMDVQERLRAAMRPLDADERIAEREIELGHREGGPRARQGGPPEGGRGAAQKHKEALRTADPERLMEVALALRHGAWR